MTPSPPRAHDPRRVHDQIIQYFTISPPKLAQAYNMFSFRGQTKQSRGIFNFKPSENTLNDEKYAFTSYNQSSNKLI